MKRVLICGSRDWPFGRFAEIKDRVMALSEDTIVIEGGAVGADRYAYAVAKARGLFVAHVACETEHWNRYGKSAGHKRNAAMLALGPDLVIAFQRDGSKGTQGTINRARELGIPVEVHTA